MGDGNYSGYPCLSDVLKTEGRLGEIDGPPQHSLGSTEQAVGGVGQWSESGLLCRAVHDGDISATLNALRGQQATGETLLHKAGRLIDPAAPASFRNAVNAALRYSKDVDKALNNSVDAVIVNAGNAEPVHEAGFWPDWIGGIISLFRKD
jgi:hypothetical protein